MVQSNLNKFYPLSLSHVQLLLQHQILQTFVTSKDFADANSKIGGDGGVIPTLLFFFLMFTSLMYPG
jgi:hypothetical protein